MFGLIKRDYSKEKYPIYPSVRNLSYKDQAKDTGVIPEWGVKRPHVYEVWAGSSAICMQCYRGHATQGLYSNGDPKKVSPQYGCPGPPAGEEALGIGDS